MERSIFATFESLVTSGSDKKAIVYVENGVYNVSFYMNDAFVYSVPQSFDSPIMAAQAALGFIAGMNFNVELSGD